MPRQQAAGSGGTLGGGGSSRGGPAQGLSSRQASATMALTTSSGLPDPWLMPRDALAAAAFETWGGSDGGGSDGAETAAAVAGEAEVDAVLRLAGLLGEESLREQGQGQAAASNDGGRQRGTKALPPMASPWDLPIGAR